MPTRVKQIKHPTALLACLDESHYVLRHNVSPEYKFMFTWGIGPGYVSTTFMFS